MPRKRTLSAIEKANRSPTEKLQIQQINRRKAERRYRRKIINNPSEHAKDRAASRRANMTEEDKAAAKEKQRAYNATYYLCHRDSILHAAMQKRARAYIDKHGESMFWRSYPHRVVKLRKEDNSN
ncbi:hypothetical protein EV361DRAFT_966732 [Lentinula raphanica]|nr:hypothetical protein EV361DRAFT_966732 [Lentinula raphanica]